LVQWLVGYVTKYIPLWFICQ